MNRNILLMVVAAWWSAAACTSQIYLPEGDPEAGRVAFSDLGCHRCHRVEGEDFPDPTVDPPVPVVLGSPINKKSREYLAESILAPSHRFAKPPSEIAYGSGEQPLIRQRQYEDIKEGSVSRMSDFRDVMYVGEWIDLGAYLDSLQNRKIAE